PDVSRSALVGVGPEGRQTPVIIIEPKSGKMPTGEDEKTKFIDELNNLGADHDFTLRISHFLFHPAFPVDIRHNAKIFREQLADWAKDKSVKF
ncbi:MAG: peptide synthase, partial [Victivallales bacterium]